MFKDTFCMTFSLPQSSKKTFSSSLRENGLRPTKQRACVYWVILGKRDHPTADDIYDRVRKHLPGTSFATVYNCLETLVGCGLVRQVNLDRSPTRYCPNLTPHAHFKCIKSGKIYDVQIDEDTLSRMHSLVPEGFEAENIDLCFSGIRKTVSN
jgi:Fur family peroxide stress response transcriptional regulator|tara:strand:- start:698 stop:1156 length:459 start_codon:yes stop_codon:yes gene_type:complete